MKRFAMIVAAAAALAGCGPGASNDMKATFDKSFNASFDKSTHDSCVSTAVGKGGAPDVVEKYCTCVVAQLDKLTVDEKMKLNQTPDKLTAAAQACLPSSSSSTNAS
jgi:hypothetical protein